jgi:hypothetical protein
VCSSVCHYRRGDCRLRSTLLAPQLGRPKDLQLSSDSFLRRHVVSSTMWTHVNEGLRELIDAGRAFLVLAEGGHETFSVQAVPVKQAVRGRSPAVVARLSLARSARDWYPILHNDAKEPRR